MSKRLQDNLTSGYLEAANHLGGRGKRQKIVAYVESYDDVFFWRSILSQFETERYYFEVMLPTRPQEGRATGERVLERGKKAALMSALSGKTGQWLIACVDADYDYLVQGVTVTSKTVIGNPYIFHTYAYAIENMQCFAPALHDVCVAVTLNDSGVFDMRRYLEDYSEAIWPLFVWNVWYYRGDSYGQFTMTDFLRVIDLGTFSMNAADQSVALVRRKVGQKCKQLSQANPNARMGWQAVEQDLLRLGLTPRTTYLYIRGHYLFDKVVVPMLSKVCDRLVRQRQNEIVRQSRHGTQRRNELSCYNNSVGDVIPMLKKSMGFVMSEPYRRIKADIEKFMQMLDDKQGVGNQCVVT